MSYNYRPFTFDNYRYRRGIVIIPMYRLIGIKVDKLLETIDNIRNCYITSSEWDLRSDYSGSLRINITEILGFTNEI